MNGKKLNRRDFLRMSTLTAAGVALAACAPSEPEAVEVEVTREVEVPVEQTVVVEATEAPAPTEAPPGPVEGNVVVMHNRAQFSEEQEAQFEADHAGITIDFLQTDMTRFFAMYAAGTPPDMLRTQAPAIPQFLARDMLLDLTPYLEVSDVLNIEDLAPANNYYRAYSPLEIGDGPVYGMCKDWSPDFSMFAYTKAFEDAGLDMPDETTHLTYQEVFELARQLAVFEGDRVLTWGYAYDGAWTDRMWMNMLAELDQNLYAEGFTAINLTGSEEARAVAKYYFDLASENLTVHPLNPSPTWIGEDFTKGTVALIQYGYWFSAMAESDVTAGQVVMLRTATWAGVPRNPTMTATGSVLAKATKVPDAAWKVFEWYNGKEPAIARAGSGWGVPALKSMYDLMPTETEYQQQVQRVLQAELDLATPPLQFNPFISEGTVVDSWNKNLQEALMGTITFDECLANVEAEVNTAIKEGIDRLT
jgi:multiple sugar transport system substrate-binding protein